MLPQNRLKWLAILNPAAQSARYRNHVHWLAKQLQDRIGADCAFTRRPGHARELAQASRGYDGCIAVGGDGTIFEVVNGFDLVGQAFAVVPVGTGNGFSRDLSLLDSRTALQALAQPHWANVDLVHARFRSRQTWSECMVTSTAAFGYVAEIVARALGPMRRLGFLRYTVAAYLQRRQHHLRDHHAHLKIDAGPWQDCVFTNWTLNNTSHAGYFRLFPNARLDDGKLDLLSARLDHVEHLLDDIGILTQTYVFEKSQRRQAETVELELTEPATLMLDGELFWQVDAVKFTVLAGKLRCCVPTLCRHFRVLQPR